MNKIKNFFFPLLIAIFIFNACENQNMGIVNPFENVDYEALTLRENDSIVKFLTTHYYDATKDSLKLITSGEQALIEDKNNLKIIDVEENNINHKLYVYITEEGIPDYRDKSDVNSLRKDNPTKMDSIFVNRTGIRLINNSIESTPFDQGDRTWWNLLPTFGAIEGADSPIKGWVEGFPSFKSGQNITDNGPITYKNTGKGYIFIPSGLAYSSSTYQLGTAVDPNYDQTLVFKVELLDIVENTDHDNDGIPSINEDADGDKDPTNDFSDTSNPNLPDYLNPNIN